MKAIHRPLKTLPAKACHTPIKTKKKPKNRPVIVAIEQERRKFFVIRHAIERKIRPPSSGNPGTRLKTPSTKFKMARYLTNASRGPALAKNGCSSQKKRAKTKLTMGPAAAIQNSTSGFGGSVAIWETPPNANSVIRGTDIRYSLTNTQC